MVSARHVSADRKRGPAGQVRVPVPSPAVNEVSRRRGPPPTTAISREETLDGMADLARRAARPITAADIQNVPRLYRGVQVHFGTVDDARRAAKLPEPERPSKWTAEKVIAELRRLHHDRVRITVPALRELGHDGLVSASQMFGGLQVMRRKAGIPEPLPLPLNRTSWDEDRVTGEILQRHSRGESLASSKVPASLNGAARKYFGSWQNAIEAAGLNYDDVRLVRRWDAKAIVNELHALRGKQPNLTRGELHHLPVGAAILIHFDGLDEALAAARVDDWPQWSAQPYPAREEALELLRQRHQAGLSLRRKDIVRDDHRLEWAVLRHFPSFRAAFAAARLPNPFPRRRWDREGVLRELRTRLKQGRSTAASDVAEGVYKAARRLFGSWDSAVRAALRGK
jgi:hypothetical protein